MPRCESSNLSYLMLVINSNEAIMGDGSKSANILFMSKRN